MALTSGETAEMASNLVIAFSGVTLALIAASIAFFILNIRRRWLLEELRLIEAGGKAVA
jgi:biopolymer transport protein ExbB/TolQ